MIFGRDRVSCDDFGDCHDEIAVAGIDFYQQVANLWPLSIGGRGASGSHLRGQRLHVIDPIIDMMVAERNSMSQDDESTSYVVPDDTTVDFLLAI